MIRETVITTDLHGERFEPRPGPTRFHGVRVESVDFSGLLKRGWRGITNRYGDD
jgi:hypothetical protein